MAKITILGAGLAGISASYHLGHQNCQIFEKNNYLGGHIHSDARNGFVWDEGPHVSFTSSDYVKELFDKNVEAEFWDYPVETTNYFEGKWIPHPAQTNLWSLPSELKEKCLDSFLSSRDTKNQNINNYEDWLIAAFGEVFYKNFPRKYTEKYWTVSPKDLTTDWVGNRVYYPEIEDVKQGAIAKLQNQTHYIKKIRYPKSGGYFSFARKMYDNSQIELNKELQYIEFDQSLIKFTDGTSHCYSKLINTIPLPILIERSNAPQEIKEAVQMLACSSVLLVNIIADHATVRKENWMYVYDQDKWSTRINCTELLSPSNGVTGQTGVQVEVYFSDYKKCTVSHEQIAKEVIEEIAEMGLIESKDKVINHHTRWVDWANVIFDHHRKEALNNVLAYLETKGLIREDDDLLPMTDWNKKEDIKLGAINLAGRFAQWKYYWTDDCVLRGKFLI
jgi:protoporphyrinogen oxidase